MKLYGLQKMTLLDFPGKVACTIFLGGCDFRCPFCHNFELVDGTAQPVLSEEELIGFLKSRIGLLEGVAITGGEPCLHRDLPDLIRRIRETGYKVKLDTNGMHAEMLEKVIGDDLVDYVAMDIKNSEEKYPLTCGVNDVNMSAIYKSIDILMNSDVDYEFRTTVVNELHEERDFERIGEMIKGAKRYFLQRFTDRDTVPYGNLTAPSFEKMRQYAEIAKIYVFDTQLRGVE